MNEEVIEDYEPLVANHRMDDIAPVLDLAIAWLDLTYRVNLLFNRQPKTLLQDISGCIDFGTITAIMGPSGAGKTTLLKCFNGRAITGMDCRSKLYTSRSFEIKSCFIVQDVKEHLLFGLTALQSNTYSSRLKNKARNVNHSAITTKLLMDLSITSMANTSVQKCSGGQQKRIAIALELIAQEKPNRSLSMLM